MPVNTKIDAKSDKNLKVADLHVEKSLPTFDECASSPELKAAMQRAAHGLWVIAIQAKMRGVFSAKGATVKPNTPEGNKAVAEAVAKIDLSKVGAIVRTAGGVPKGKLQTALGLVVELVKSKQVDKAAAMNAMLATGEEQIKALSQLHPTVAAVFAPKAEKKA